jgi:hypothetical protein
MGTQWEPLVVHLGAPSAIKPGQMIAKTRT